MENMSTEREIAAEADHTEAHLDTEASSTEATNQPEEIGEVRSKIKKRLTPPVEIGAAFAVPGIASLVLSVAYNSSALAFIGLGLTFWGALFFLIRPVAYVKSNLLDAAAISSYKMIDRIVRDLKYKGKGFYLPPYPKDVYLPEHLKGLKELIIFIPADGSGKLPPIEEIAKSKFILENPKAICLPPPGLELADQIEEASRMDLAGVGLERLCETLPQLILENFQLAKEIEMKVEENLVRVRISDSIYRNLYRENLKSVHSLGCPLISAIACELARSTGKMVAVQSLNVSPDAQIVEASYSLIEG